MDEHFRQSDVRAFFFTGMARSRAPVFLQMERRLALRDAVLALRARQQFETLAWVLLPDHFHAIWKSAQQVSSRALQEGFGDGIRIKGPMFLTPAAARQLAARVHDDPVHHGLVAHRDAWHWSSLHGIVRRQLILERTKGVAQSR